MARREDYEHWSMGLPIESETLQDVDTVCEELGLQRAEVCRLIVITWSKARRGKAQELWGFTPSMMFTTSTHGQHGTPGLSENNDVQMTPSSVPPRRKKIVSETTAAAVQGLTLDLD